MDMNTLNQRYNDLLFEFEIEERGNHKKHIKQLILENIQNAEFCKSPKRNEAERVCSKKTSECILDNAIKQSAHDDLNSIFKVATMLRKEILSHDKWKYKGSFEDFALPHYLPILIKWILTGPKRDMMGEIRV